MNKISKIILLLAIILNLSFISYLTWGDYSISSYYEKGIYEEKWLKDIKNDYGIPKDSFIYARGVAGMPIVICTFKQSAEWIESAKNSTHTTYETHTTYLDDILPNIFVVSDDLREKLKDDPNCKDLYSELHVKQKYERMLRTASPYNMMNGVSFYPDNEILIGEERFNRVCIRIAYKQIDDNGQYRIIMGIWPFADTKLKK